jgi:Zn-finger nucleic acid-binding protein
MYVPYCHCLDAAVGAAGNWNALKGQCVVLNPAFVHSLESKWVEGCEISDYIWSLVPDNCPVCDGVHFDYRGDLNKWLAMRFEWMFLDSKAVKAALKRFEQEDINRLMEAIAIVTPDGEWHSLFSGTDEEQEALLTDLFKRFNPCWLVPFNFIDVADALFDLLFLPDIA